MTLATFLTMANVLISVIPTRVMTLTTSILPELHPDLTSPPPPLFFKPPLEAKTPTEPHKPRTEGAGVLHLTHSLH